MPRLIDADALKEDIEQQCALLRLMKDNDELNQISTVLESGFMAQIDKMPTIEERKKGKWIIEPHKVKGMYIHRCSECFSVLMIASTDRPKYRYCPNCGSYNGGETWEH